MEKSGRPNNNILNKEFIEKQSVTSLQKLSNDCENNISFVFRTLNLHSCINHHWWQTHTLLNTNIAIVVTLDKQKQFVLYYGSLLIIWMLFLITIWLGHRYVGYLLIILLVLVIRCIIKINLLLSIVPIVN